MKRILALFVLACGVVAGAQTVCNLPPGGFNHGTVASCTLPPVLPNQCVHYEFNWSSNLPSSQTFGYSVVLGESTVLSFAAPTGSGPSVYQVSGKVCGAGLQTLQWAASRAVVQDTALVSPPFFTTTFEDLSVPQNLVFSVAAPRGFGVAFQGGLIEVW